MRKPSKSPDRGNFQRDNYLKRCSQDGNEPNQDYLEYFSKIAADMASKWDDGESRTNNMEWDLVSTEWICDKVRASEVYSQNLYAALCNNDYVRVDLENTVENILTVLEEGQPKWSCSWRYAGGIIADMRGEGDYIDWYCSGIRGGLDLDESAITDEERKRMETIEKYVGEGYITGEVRSDLRRLGWVAVEDPDET